MKKFAILLFFVSAGSFAQQLAPLTVGKIMRDPKWIGVAPSNIFWAEDGKQLYFNWNPDKNPGDSLYTISTSNRIPQKVSPAVRRTLPALNGNYNRTRTKKLYEKNGDIFLLDVSTGKTTQITFTTEREFNPTFSSDERKVVFIAGMNLFSWEIGTGVFVQLSDFRKGTKKSDAKLTDQDKWLKADQLAYFQVLKERNTNKKATERMQKADRPRRPKEIYIEEKNVDQLQYGPNMMTDLGSGFFSFPFSDFEVLA